MNNAIPSPTNLLGINEIEALGYEFTKDSGYDFCSKCILSKHDCGKIHCNYTAIADPRGLGVKILLVAADIRSFHA